ncbi:velvet factor [Coprinopsis sp. MPI-PUGE-AT-0042]|nr:velvet factor [Coprinopsis sp. MPI-PUGE-AT-0042]
MDGETVHCHMETAGSRLTVLIRYYSLEVVQHPLRARMCGFGDKDRRPLAPAAVAKMIVRTEDQKLVDVDDVDCSFFLVTVDLWSADGKQEMNLVLHPSSSDKYAPPNPPSKQPSTRRRTISSSQSRGQANQASKSSTPTPQRPDDQSPPNGNSNYYPTDGSSSHASYPPPSSDPPQTWGYPPPLPSADRSGSFSGPVLPSIQSFHRTASSEWSSSNNDDNYPIDPALRSGSDGYSTTNNGDQPVHAASGAPYPPPPASSYPSGPPAHSSSGTATPQSTIPRNLNTYTRTLVGPLSANACRLLDEHRKPGIFFLFQDLSVRTEGTFRLRMRLMNVGAPPAPEAGSSRVHNDVSPILAQTFTEAFTVFSAKRFPGVPDTTALSIAFGNQGQKLPLRNRHGTGSKRRRRNQSGSEDESDDDS